MSAPNAGADGELMKMHRAARLKTHAMRRIMERLPGVCPGSVLRQIDATVNGTDPLAIIDGEALYRVFLPDGRSFVAIWRVSDSITFTVMTTPCEAWVGNRKYHVTETSIVRIKNVSDPFRHNRRRFKRAKLKARQRLL